MSQTSSLHKSPNKKISILSSSNIAKIAQETAIEERGLDVRALNLKGLSDVADYFVIASGTSNRHASNIAEKVKVRLKDEGEKVVFVTPKESSDWMILDYGNVVVHVFQEESRHFYKLDQLWKDAEVLEVACPQLKKEAAKLWTGIFEA